MGCSQQKLVAEPLQIKIPSTEQVVHNTAIQIDQVVIPVQSNQVLFQDQFGSGYQSQGESQAIDKIQKKQQKIVQNSQQQKEEEESISSSEKESEKTPQRQEIYKQEPQPDVVYHREETQQTAIQQKQPLQKTKTIENVVTLKGKLQQCVSFRQLTQVLQQTLKQNKLYSIIIDVKYVIKMTQEFERCYLNVSQKDQLVSLIHSYLNRSVAEHQSPSSSEQLAAFTTDLASKWYRLRNDIHVMNKKYLQVLDFICRKKEGEARTYQQCFLDLKFDLSPQQAGIVCSVVLKMMRVSWKSFYFLTAYLEASAYQLQKRNVPLIQINGKINQALQIGITLSGVPFKRQQEGPIISKHNTFKTKGYRKQYIETTKIPKSDLLSVIDSHIINSAKETVKSANLLDKLTQICKQYGSDIQTILYQDSKFGLIRARLSILDAAIQKIDLQKRVLQNLQFSIDEQINQQLANYQKQFTQIIGMLSQDVQFKISNFVILSCLFDNIGALNTCADRLKEVIQKEKYSLTQIVNTLNSNSQSAFVIFRISIQNKKFQIHLLFNYNLPKLIFKEQIDFMTSQKLFSPLTALKLINEAKAKPYFEQLNSVIAGNLSLRARTNLKQNTTFQIAGRSFEQLITLLPFTLDCSPQQQSFQQEKQRLIEILKQRKEDQKFNFLAHQRSRRDAQFKQTVNQNSQALEQYTHACHLLSIYRQPSIPKSPKRVSLIKSSSSLKLAITDDKPKLNETQTLVFCLLRVGKLYIHKGNYDKAIESYQQCLEQCKNESFSLNKKFVSQAQAGMGWCEYKKGYYSKAIDIFQKCIRNLPQQSSKQQNRLLILLKNMTNVLKDQGIKHQALKYNEKCLNIVRKQKGEKSFELVQFLSFNVDILESMGDLETAIQEQSDILDIIAQTKGKNTVQFAQNLKRKGQLSRKFGLTPSALQLYQRSIRIKENLYGSNSLHSVKQFVFTAQANSSLQRYQIAIQDLLTCVSILEQQKNKRNSQIADLYFKIAQNYEADLNYSQALKYYQQCQNIREKIAEHDVSSYLSLIQKIISILGKLKNISQQSRYQKLYAKVNKKESGNQSVNHFQNLNKIAQKSFERGNYPLSLKYLNRCLEITRKQGKDGTLEQVQLLKKIANINCIQGQTSKSIQLLDGCLQILRQKKGSESFEIAQVYVQLGKAFTQVQDFSQAANHFQNALSLCQKYKIKYYDYAHASFGLANCEFLQGKFSDALKYYQQAAPMLQKMKSELYASAIQKIGNCRHQINNSMNNRGNEREEATQLRKENQFDQMD